jgi:hypothetical protein
MNLGSSSAKSAFQDGGYVSILYQMVIIFSFILGGALYLGGRTKPLLHYLRFMPVLRWACMCCQD